MMARIGVDDAGMPDAVAVETLRPGHQSRQVVNGEREMIEADPAVVERQPVTVVVLGDAEADAADRSSSRQ